MLRCVGCWSGTLSCDIIDVLEHSNPDLILIAIASAFAEIFLFLLPSRNSDPEPHAGRLFHPPTIYAACLAYLIASRLLPFFPSSIRAELRLPKLSAVDPSFFFLFENSRSHRGGIRTPRSTL